MNLHSLDGNQALNLARLPIPPLRQLLYTIEIPPPERKSLARLPPFLTIFLHPMRVFVSEFLSTGVVAGQPPSLSREGLAMLLRRRRRPGRLSRRRGRHRRRPGTRRPASSARPRRPGSRRRVRGRGSTLSPSRPRVGTHPRHRAEFDDLLATRADWATAEGSRLLGAQSLGIRLTGDKLRLADLWKVDRIPTPETRPCGEGACPFPFPVVVKPRFGAGARGDVSRPQ